MVTNISLEVTLSSFCYYIMGMCCRCLVDLVSLLSAQVKWRIRCQLRFTLFHPFSAHTNPFSESANTAKFSGLTIFQINNQFTWYIVWHSFSLFDPTSYCSVSLLFLKDCFVWFGEESVITFICHQRAGKNRGKKPLVTLVTNWAFLIKTDAKQGKTPKQSRIKEKWKVFIHVVFKLISVISAKLNYSFPGKL